MLFVFDPQRRAVFLVGLVPDRDPASRRRVRRALEDRGEEVETLSAYVKALGGKLKIIADFVGESYVLG